MTMADILPLYFLAVSGFLLFINLRTHRSGIQKKIAFYGFWSFLALSVLASFWLWVKPLF